MHRSIVNIASYNSNQRSVVDKEVAQKAVYSWSRPYGTRKLDLSSIPLD